MQKKERKYIEKSNPNKVCQTQLAKHLKMFIAVQVSQNVGILHGEKGALPPKYYFRWFAVVRIPRLQTLLVHYVHEKEECDKDIITREAEFKTTQ